MTLREQLRRAVAGQLHVAHPKECNTQLSGASDATGPATVVQRPLAKPHENWGSGATGRATAMQPRPITNATTGSELQVARTRECNTQPFRLSQDDADRCHAPCWDDAEVSTFTQRVLVFMRQGIEAADADDLAERLVLRDRDLDERRLCLECSHLMTSGRCAAAARGDLTGVDPRLEPVQTVLQRCEAFKLREGLT